MNTRVFPTRESYDELSRLLTSDLFLFRNTIAASSEKLFQLEPEWSIVLSSVQALSDFASSELK
jgi:hypothetical protein